MASTRTVQYFLSIAFIAFLCFSRIHGVGVAVMAVDFGSEFIKIAIVKPGVPMEIAFNEESKRKTPNIISLKDGDRYFSDAALISSVKYPKLSYSHFLDLLGKGIDNPLVRLFQKRFPHLKILPDEVRDTVMFQHTQDVKYSVEELTAMILKKCQHIAENFAEEPISGAVLTVPAFFNQAERRSIIRSADIAGLKVLQLMSDTSAVALNYGVFRRNSFNTTAQYVMYYDVGSSSTKVSIVEYKTVSYVETGMKEMVPQLTIKGIGFDRTLGGLQFDYRLRDHFVKHFQKKYKSSVDITESSRAMAKMLKEAKRVKHVLSANQEHMAQIEGVHEEIDFRLSVKRSELEVLCSDLYDRFRVPVKEALEAAGEMTLSEIDQVVLFGAGTRMPKVQDKILEAVGNKELARNLNTDEAAAMGAVYQAAHLSQAFRVKKFLVKDVTIFPIEVEFDRVTKSETDGEEDTIKNVVRTLWARGSSYPQRKVMTFSRMYDDFTFYVNYGNLSSIMSPHDVKAFGRTKLFQTALSDIPSALAKPPKEASNKGIKVHFRMDANGLLILDEVQSVFEVKVEQAASNETEPSTLEKLGNSISSASDKPETNTTDATNVTSDIPDTSGASSTAEKPNNDTGSANKSASGEETSKEVPEKVLKNQTLKEKVAFSTSYRDVVDLSSDHVKDSMEKLRLLDQKDLEKRLMEKARNDLESYILSTQEKLHDEEHSVVTTEEELIEINDALVTASDWLYEDGEFATSQEYTDKHSSLKNLCKQMFHRVHERREWPSHTGKLRELINASRIFLNATTLFSPDESIFTPVEIVKLLESTNTTETWLNDITMQQEKLSPKVDAVLRTADIISKYANLEREVQYLYTKMRLHKPKPKVHLNNSTKPETGSNESVERPTTEDDLSKTEKPDLADDTKGADLNLPEGNQGDSSGEDGVAIASAKVGTVDENSRTAGDL